MDSCERERLTLISFILCSLEKNDFFNFLLFLDLLSVRGFVYHTVDLW